MVPRVAARSVLQSDSASVGFLRLPLDQPARHDWIFIFREAFCLLYVAAPQDFYCCWLLLQHCDAHANASAVLVQCSQLFNDPTVCHCLHFR